MQSKISKFQGPILIIIAATLWGIDGLLRRELYALPPSVIVFYEHLIGAIIISPFLFGALRKEKIAKRDWTALFWISLLSGVMGTLFFTAALVKINFISISVVYLLQKLQPIFAVASAAVILKEKITARYVAWAGLALVAAYFVTFNNGVVNLSTGNGTLIAALLALGAAFFWGSSTAISRFTLQDLSVTLTTGLRFMISVPLALAAVAVTRSTDGLSQLTTGQVTSLIVIALTTGMVALWIYYKGLQVTQVKVATVLELFFPLTAIIIDVVHYHTVLGISQYLAGIVLLFAAYKVSQLNVVKE